MRRFSFHFSGLVQFARDRSGSVALTGAVALLVLVVGVGAALDLGRAVLTRQKLSESAQHVCQYAGRSSITQLNSTSDSGAAYSAKVASYVATALQMQKFSGTQSNATPFAFTEGGAGNVRLAASSPTTFLQILNITQIPLGAQAHCFDTLPSTSPAPPAKPSAGQQVITEGFEISGCSGSCGYFYAPGVAAGVMLSSATSTFPATATYTGSGSTPWYVMGYCLEVDYSALVVSTATEGSHSAELDCDNSSNTAGNSSISTQTYLYAGVYELRWSYKARIAYPNYNPVALCGNQASDLSWANDASPTGSVTSGARTNQINVYLDHVANASSSPPTHWTLDNSQKLAGSSLIDMCVYSASWVQRSVTITVSQAGWYWLSFAADGQSDSLGGAIDNIKLCYSACTGSVSSSFPSAWTAGATLFQDDLGSFSYTNAALGNLEFGDSATGATMPGWPNVSGQSWLVAPYSKVTQVNKNFKQYVQLDTGDNEMIARPFLLAPGYYQLAFDYISGVTASIYSATTCGSTPAGAYASLYLTANPVSATDQLTSQTKNIPTGQGDTDFVGAFIAHAQLASTPNAASFKSAAKYTNPDGSITASPAAPANAISLSSYVASSTVALLDLCSYSNAGTTQTSKFQITKPAYYWLTFSALGTADGSGGWLANVKLTVLGSPYMTSPPASPVVVPAPAPILGASVALPTTLPDFAIAADTFAP